MKIHIAILQSLKINYKKMRKILDRTFKHLIGASEIFGTVRNRSGYKLLRFNKQNNIKMCKSCSAFHYNGLWYDEAPSGLASGLDKEVLIKLDRCPTCIYLEYKEKCLLCRNPKNESPCPSCQYLYYKANQSIGVATAEANWIFSHR